MTRIKQYSLSAAIILVVAALGSSRNPTDITSNSVMITNKTINSGGTGIVYQSTAKGSFVLTNRHVCKVVENGGVVKSSNGVYQVQSIQESQISDLCLVYVPSNLHQNTKVASNYPTTFAPAKISGHPALMPTVITTGHFSGRQIIQVFIGMRPCTDDEASDPNTSMICEFFGGFPILKSYDAQLVTATIMPGSSGSGVYNKNNELSGVVFAGQGDFGYAWIVNYDEVVQFLTKEIYELKPQLIDQTVAVNGSAAQKTDIKKKCLLATDKNVLKVCEVMHKDVVW